MGEDLPIDIHYNKLLDWLLSRRHCPGHWQQSVLTVRERINNAIQDMPAVEDVTRLLQGTYINYFHCVEIVRLLKLTEDNSKNIFGRYSSQRLKDWTDILKAYEKDDVFLAEAAQLLARYVNYEIPTLKRQLAKCVQSQQDYARKEVEYSKQSAELHDNYVSSCKQMGIEGKKVKHELLQLVRDLPSTYNDIAARIRPLSSAVQYYEDFVKFILAAEVHASQDCVPLLRYIIEKGNVTTYEWRTGKTPKSVECTTVELSCADDDDTNKTETANEIDWGDIGEAQLIADTVDITNIPEEVAETEAEIDWSTVDDLGSGIELEVTGDLTCLPSTVEFDNTDGEVACGVDALSLLDNSQTRVAIVDELIEVEAFIDQRVIEMTSDSGSDVLAAAMLQSAPQSLHISSAQLSALLADIRSILALLSTPRMRDLILIRSSPRYVDRLAANLRKLAEDSDKAASLSRLMATRREEVVAEQQTLEPQLDVMRQKMKQLQKQIEGEISKRYKNRRVNIMGEINTV